MAWVNALFLRNELVHKKVNLKKHFVKYIFNIFKFNLK